MEAWLDKWSKLNKEVCPLCLMIYFKIDKGQTLNLSSFVYKVTLKADIASYVFLCEHLE